MENEKQHSKTELDKLRSCFTFHLKHGGTVALYSDDAIIATAKAIIRESHDESVDAAERSTEVIGVLAAMDAYRDHLENTIRMIQTGDKLINKETRDSYDDVFTAYWTVKKLISEAAKRLYEIEWDR